MPLSQTQLDIISILKKAQNILVLPSSPLDGDSLGSALSFYLALKKLGKKVTVVAEEIIPESYKFLPEISAVNRGLNVVRDFIVTIDCRDMPPGNVRHEIQGNKINIIVTPAGSPVTKEQVSFTQGGVPFDAIVTVDAADVSQFGKIYENFTELFHLAPVINIDHHTSNNSFGKINHVDVMASSATMLVLPFIEELGPNLMDADIATLLLVGLITDTGSFQNPNTTPDAFAVAAKLIGYGARQQEIIRHMYKTKKLSTLRLWGRALTKLQYDEAHRMVWSVLTAKDFAEIGSGPDETEGVIDELMGNAPGTEIIFLLKEKGPMEISGSIRTLTPAIDASKLAGLFGGGGHMQAAGFKVHGKNITDVEKEVVEAIRNFQKARTSGASANSTPKSSPIGPEPSPSLIAQPATPLAVPTPKPQPPAPSAPAPPQTFMPPTTPAPAPSSPPALSSVKPLTPPQPTPPFQQVSAPPTLSPSSSPPPIPWIPTAPTAQKPDQKPASTQTPPAPPMPPAPPSPRIPGSTFPLPPGIN